MTLPIPKLASHFYDVSSPECNRLHPSFKPAVEFEVLNGVTGIAGLWQFPGGKSAFVFEQHFLRYNHVNHLYTLPGPDNQDIRRIAQATPNRMKSLRRYWSSLVDLNPALAAVTPRFDEPIDLHDAIRGVASLFNADDIQFFLKARQSSGTWFLSDYCHKDPEYRKLRTAIVNRGGDPRWVPAPVTLQRMIAQLEAR